MTQKIDRTDAVLAVGLNNTWYAICPSHFIADRPVSMKRLGVKLVLWRDAQSKLYALEDHCPHRGAPLSKGILLGDRISCGYHGVEVRGDGVVTKVPGSPGCSLEGKRAGRAFHVVERNDMVFLYNALVYPDQPPAFTLPEELTSEDYFSFICYSEWKADYRYVIDNLMDPMHGTYLHKQSHSMQEGSSNAKFSIRDTDQGFIFEKVGQRGVNFDWTEWADTGIHWMRLEIPYPATGGPGGDFAIVAMATPIDTNQSMFIAWRCRKVSGWQRNVWKFLYRNRLEARHWAVLEQDRVVLELMEPDANQRENLYQHDVGLVRLRRHLRELASRQLGDMEDSRPLKPVPSRT